jgi:hypothetical protein
VQPRAIDCRIFGITMNKDHFKTEYESYTSEYLLQLRARADGLVDEAHTAIEEVLASRGESFPPRPKLAVAAEGHTRPKGQQAQNLIIGILFMFLSAFLLQVLKENRLVGMLLSLTIAVFFLVRWYKDINLAPEERTRKQALKRIGEDGFTELMFCAGEGDLDRVRDLVNYGGMVNAQDDKGGTALMYASKNGHLDVVKFLLMSGAKVELRTEKGLSALDVARKSGHVETAEFLAR